MSNAWNNNKSAGGGSGSGSGSASAGTSIWGRKYTSGGAGGSSGSSPLPMKKPDTGPICAWIQPGKKEEAVVPKTGASGYVPPSKREAPKQTFEEAFPTLAGGAPAAKNIEGAMKFGDMAKTRAEKDATIAEVLRKEEAARAAANRNGANSIHQYAVGPNFARYHQAVREREAEAAYRRRRIFDDESDEEEWEEETPEEDSDEFENRSDGADGEEELDGYDASAFDRHR